MKGEGLMKGEDTDGSYEFSQQSPATPSPQRDLEATLTSLLEGGEDVPLPKRNDFLVNGAAITSTPSNECQKTGGGDSGIDPGFWVRSVSQSRLGQQADGNNGGNSEQRSDGLRLEKTFSPLVSSSVHYRETSDSSEMSFHLPSPSYAWAPPSSPVPSRNNSFSFPTSPNSPKKPTAVLDDSSIPVGGTESTIDVGVARHLSDSQPCAFGCKEKSSLTSLSTPNLQSV